MSRPIYPRKVYSAAVSRVIDADTVSVTPSDPTRLRLLGFDAAELRGASDEEEAIAREQTAWVRGWLQEHEIAVDGRGYDPFGRLLAWIRDAETGECLNLQFVKRYPDRARNPRKQAEQLYGDRVGYDQYKP